MAVSVLVEGISVVVRVDTIEEKYPGGLEQYRRDCPNLTFCEDGKLTRIGFMTPADVGVQVRALEERSMVFKRDGKCVDVAVVDQREGPTVPCDWLHYAKDDRGMAYCWLDGTEPGEVSVPEGWKWEESLSSQFTFVPTEEMPDRLIFVRSEGGVDVYRDRETGEEVYTGNTREQRELAEARKAFLRGVELIAPYVPNEQRPYAVAETEHARQRILEGIEYLKSAAEKAPGVWEAHLHAGWAYEILEEHEEAYRWFRRAHEIDPEESELWRALQGSCLRLGRVDEAVALGERLVKRQPDDAGMRADLGLALLLGGRLTDARRHIEKALEMDPTDEITQVLMNNLEKVESGEMPQPQRLSDM